MFEDLERIWTEQEKEDEFVRDRIGRQVIKLAIVLLALLGIFVWHFLWK